MPSISAGVREGSTGRKCNIDFAHDLFREIRKHDGCVVVALDNRKYFESIDHGRSYFIWYGLLGVDRLPDDRLAIFKAITRFRYVDRIAVYERLEYIADKKQKNGSIRPRYTVSFHKMPKQLCTPQVFCEKIAGEGDAY